MSYVVLATSSDDGRNWSEPKLVIDPPGNVTAGNSALWHDASGRLWLFWTQSYLGNDGRHGVWAIISEDPDDENPTWSHPLRLADGMALNKATVLSNGDWVLPIAVSLTSCVLPNLNDTFGLRLTPSVVESLCHDLGGRKGTSVYRSVDHGRTWEWFGQAVIPDVCCEHMIVERRDRSLWMPARTFYGIGQSVSTDGGKTWGQSGPSGIRHPVTRFFLRRLKSGRLLLVRHNPPEQLTRSHLTAYLSNDDGGSWSGALLLDGRNSVAYPDGVEAANGTIYVIYDRGRNTDREILMATFTEDDVKQGKCVTAECRLQMLVNKAGG
jgi:predicted neuraminidase